MNRVVIMNRFYLVLIGAMAIYIFFLQACNGGNKRAGELSRSMDVTKIKVMEKPKFYPVYKPVPVEVQVPGPSVIDSIPYTDSTYCKELAIDHYSTRTYSDTLHGDTCDVYVRGRVYGNRLDSVQVGYKVNVPFTTVLPADRFQVFLAGNVGTNLKGFTAGPEIIFKDRRNFLYKAGVDFNTTGDITYRVGFGALIRFPKKVRR